ncbi:MAG: Lrp/AsnC family transcriptional regulator [Promethearchaeota archaeon]
MTNPKNKENKIKPSPYKRSKDELQPLVEDNPDVDLIDISILSKLQMDGRASFNMLADELGLSVATVSKRVKNLEDKGVIRGFSAVVACEKLGFKENLWVMLYLEPGAHIDRIGEKVSTFRGVKCVYSLFSDFDLLVHLCCATSDDIDNAILEIGKIDGVVKVTKMSVYKKIKEDFRVQI